MLAALLVVVLRVARKFLPVPVTALSTELAETASLTVVVGRNGLHHARMRAGRKVELLRRTAIDVRSYYDDSVYENDNDADYYYDDSFGERNSYDNDYMSDCGYYSGNDD